jgi:hypothetical protein
VVHVGAVRERACLGDGARGLQRRRQAVGVPAARARALAGLPLERGWARRDLRRPPAAVPRARAVERARPDAQGADLRTERRRGQPRRGRQGVLVVPRRAAEPRLAALALPLPAGGVPLRRPGRHQPGAHAAGPGVRAARHRRLRRRPLLGRRGRLRQGRPDGRADAGAGDERRRRGGRAARAADAVVPQPLGLGAGCRAAQPAGGALERRDRGGGDARLLRADGRAGARRDGAAAVVLRERDERGAAVRVG